MTDIAPFLKSLLSTAGISGHESPAADLIRARWQPLADEISTSPLGSIHALRRGTAPGPRPTLLLSAHMDAIGMMVSAIEDGFLRLAPIGGIDTRLLPGLPVTVHAREPLPGIIAARPPLLMPEDERKDAPSWEHLLVDVGLPPRRVSQLIHIGDLVSFANEPLQLGGELVSGHSLDNRASVVALTLTLEALQAKGHACDVWFAATTQEEISLAGAATSAFALRPDLAIVLDVTYGAGAGSHGWEFFPLGGGPTLGVGPHIHPFLMKRLKSLAETLEIPFALEPMPVSSFTETEAVQLSGQGLPTAVLSIPIRNMHTPVEVVDLTDIARTARLLTELVLTLEPDFPNQVAWDD